MQFWWIPGQLPRWAERESRSIGNLQLRVYRAVRYRRSRIVVAGGLTPANVAEAISSLKSVGRRRGLGR